MGGVSRILLGSLVGQGAILLVSPFLTRLYSPADFGALAVVTAISAVLGNVVTLSWERAIVLPEDDNRAKDIVLLGVISVSFLVSALALVAYLTQETLSHLFDSEVFLIYWWLVPVTVGALGFYTIASSWLVRRQEYPSLAIRNAVQGVSQASSSIILGLSGVGSLGLISSVAVGRIAALVGMVRFQKMPSSRRRELKVAALRYKRFPLVNMWSRVLNSLGLQLPVILIVALYGSVEAGLYALTLRVLAAPVGIVADAVSQYFEGSFASQNREGGLGLRHMLSTFAFRLLAVAALPAVTVAVAGPLLFQLVFGAEWATAGFYAQLLVISYFAQFVVSPISRALVILEYQGTQLAWDASRLAATSAAVLLSWVASDNFVVCAVALASVQTLWYAVLFFLCRSAAIATERKAKYNRENGL
nr:oligosaccharide flippase family protein [Salinibacterium sp. UTAS2018]